MTTPVLKGAIRLAALNYFYRFKVSRSDMFIAWGV